MSVILERKFPMLAHCWIFLLTCVTSYDCPEGFDSIIEVEDKLSDIFVTSSYLEGQPSVLTLTLF
jgi:hypothetical protein